MNPTGNNTAPDYPYFVTTQPLVIKKIALPAGTTLIYKEHAFKKGEQSEMMSEAKLTDIRLPKGETIIWGGVPVTSIRRFFNTEMRGYSVYADFERLPKEQRTRFSQLWKSCDSDLGVLVKNIDDWSFNTQNIEDVSSCSVLYQRFFKKNAEQQQFLNTLYSELLKVGGK